MSVLARNPWLSLYLSFGNTMTKFINLGRSQAENFTYQENWACISIISPEGEDTNFVCPNLFAVIRLKFHDIDYIDNGIDGLNMITDEQALDIVKFVDLYYNKVPLIVVHCEAGISRSAAVAAALTNLYQESDSHFFRFFFPNMAVYSAIRKAYISYHGEKEERK